MAYTYQYPRPALTTDCVIFGHDGQAWRVLLIQRKNPPYQDCWALPGGFVELHESLEAAALRELREETGLDNVTLEQLHTFGDVGRDPRERVVSVAYVGLVNIADHSVRADDDARRVEWIPLDQLPALAFDHDRIIQMALPALKVER